jgi:hypothetical protein
MVAESFKAVDEEGVVVAAAATLTSCGVCSLFLQLKANRTAQIRMGKDFIGLISTNVKKEKE